MCQPQSDFTFTNLINDAVNFGTGIEPVPADMETGCIQGTDKFRFIVRNHGDKKLVANAHVVRGHH